MTDSAEHTWLAPGEAPNFTRWTCCALCGKVKRNDGRPDSACRGLVRVELRFSPPERYSEPRPWNGWSRTPSGTTWHRVEHDSRSSTSTLACTGQIVPEMPGTGYMDYRWLPEQRSRCLRCAPAGWVLEAA